MRGLAPFLIGMAARRKGKHFEQVTRNPVRAQTQLLRDTMERNKGTEYGREHSFANVHCLAHYRSVPPMDYEDIRELIERVTRGEKNILTAEDPVLFALRARPARRSTSPSLKPAVLRAG